MHQMQKPICGETVMKVWIYYVEGGYDEGDDVRKVFESNEKAQSGHKKLSDEIGYLEQELQSLVEESEK